MTVAKPRHAAARSTVIALLAIVGGAAIGAFGWRQTPEQWFASYLVAWLYWAGVSLGALSLLLLHNLTSGKWGDAVRSILHAAAAVLPLMALLVLPIVLQPERLYHWADPYAVEHDLILQHKEPYLNVEFFQLRAAIYFSLWLGLLLLLAWQARSAAAPGAAAERPARRFGGQGLALHGLAVSFAAVDWMMSLEPHWFSTIYGVLVFASQGLAALALAIVVASIPPPLKGGVREGIVETDAWHDLGKLLLGFVMLWAYLAFSQFLIIWYGNLPEEVVWYLKRIEGPWLWLAIALPLLHFAVPFALLLGREIKRTPTRLGAVAALIVVMHWFDTVWMIQPAIERDAETLWLPWLDAGLTLAIGGVWWIAFAALLGRARVRAGRVAEGARHE